MILLIDDEELVRSTAKAILERAGYTVLLGRDGADGLRILRRPEKKIDLVLLDMSMPGKSGVEVLKEIRVLDDKIPVAIASGIQRRRGREAIRIDHDLRFRPKTLHQFAAARRRRRIVDASRCHRDPIMAAPHSTRQRHGRGVPSPENQWKSVLQFASSAAHEVVGPTRSGYRHCWRSSCSGTVGSSTVTPRHAPLSRPVAARTRLQGYRAQRAYGNASR